MPLGAVPAACFADGRTHGGLTEGHVSTGQEPPGSAMFAFLLVHFVTFVLGHMSPQDSNTCRLLTCPCGTTLYCHMSLPGCDMWCLLTYPRATTVLGHMSVLVGTTWCLHTCPCVTLLLHCVLSPGERSSLFISTHVRTGWSHQPVLNCPVGNLAVAPWSRWRHLVPIGGSNRY